MRINAAYKEGLKRILETSDMSRVRQEWRDCVFGRRGSVLYFAYR